MVAASSSSSRSRRPYPQDELDADGFSGVFPEALGHLCAVTGDGANDALAHSHVNVGIAVEGATDTARSATDVVLTEPSLSTIVHAIRSSRNIFQRMRNYAIYACAITICIVVCFPTLAFAFNFDFPPFLVLIIALLNNGAIMTLSAGRDPAEIFAYAVAHGLYLTLSPVALVAIIRTTWFYDKLGATLFGGVHQATHHGRQVHMIIYLQVAIISQALTFVPPSGMFCISSIIAACGNWGFKQIEAISGTWIGVVWIWDIV
ncbi:putative plasmamembrane-ATPase [Ganoderma leucocontextum]|nr:putative plasmamembrane-ATPase [Ganoderma leucocontextum]